MKNQTKIFYDNEINSDILNSLQIGLIGYGNQGQAQALNLRDSGINLIIGARLTGNAYNRAKADGFEVFGVDYIAANCDLIIMLMPDEVMKDVYENHLEPYLKSKVSFIFAHGFVITNKLLRIPDSSDVMLVAPTGPGRILRNLYLEGQGLPALFAISSDVSGNALETCLTYGKAIGCARAGLIETSFNEETIVDLFCEQAVLCGGIPGLIKASFNTLVARGYNPDLAYISCLKEVKLISDLMFDQGIAAMRQAISNTAKYGAYQVEEKIINAQVYTKLDSILDDIESSKFARTYLESFENNFSDLNEWLLAEKKSTIVKTGNELKAKLKF